MFLSGVLFLLYILLIVFIFAVIIGMVYVVFPIVLFRGGPYVVTREEYSLKMIALTKPKAGEKMLDLGSGDGRIVIDFARRGVLAHGYEINPYLVRVSQRKIVEQNLEQNAFIYCKDFWRETLSEFDVIAIYPAGFMLDKLEKKFESELKPGTRVVINGFKLPNWDLKERDGQVYLYEKS